MTRRPSPCWALIWCGKRPAGLRALHVRLATARAAHYLPRHLGQYRDVLRPGRLGDRDSDRDSGSCLAVGYSSSVSAAPLNPAHIPSVSALVPALVLGVLSFTGFDAISTVAEETRTPRKLIPRATILATVLVGLFWIVMSVILSDALPPSVYIRSSRPGVPPRRRGQRRLRSAGRDIIDIMGLKASFGLLIAAAVGSTPVMFAMGRDGVLDRRLGLGASSLPRSVARDRRGNRLRRDRCYPGEFLPGHELRTSHCGCPT